MIRTCPGLELNYMKRPTVKASISDENAYACKDTTGGGLGRLVRLVAEVNKMQLPR